MKTQSLPTGFVQTGPRIESSSVKVYKDAKIMRLSPDLVDAIDSNDPEFLLFTSFVDSKKKILVLQRAKTAGPGVFQTWKSNPGASRSVLISCPRILDQLGIADASAPGTYRAEVKAGAVYVYFREKL